MFTSVTASWHTRGCRRAHSRWFRGPSSSYTSSHNDCPALVIHSNGTYDWSCGLHPLIWRPSCYFTLSHAFHDTVRSVGCLSGLHAPAVHSPSICRQLVDSLGQRIHIRCLRLPADIRHGTRHWFLSAWAEFGCWVWGSIDRCSGPVGPF